MNLLLCRVQVVLRFGAISKLLLNTCLRWHRQLSSLPAVSPLFRFLFTCLLVTLLFRFFSESFLYPDPCVLSLAPILGFGSRVTSALVCFFSPESPSSTSRYFRASAPCAARSIALAVVRFSSPALLAVVLSLCRLFLQRHRHLGVVYSDVERKRSLQHHCVQSCYSSSQCGLLFLRTGISVVSFSLLHVMSVSHAAT